MSAIAVREVEQQLLDLGVQRGGALLVHTSFRTVRPVEGGPLGLISALRGALGPDSTLVVPTMSDGEFVFDPRTTPSFGIGISAELFWRQPGVVRSRLRDRRLSRSAHRGRWHRRIVSTVRPANPRLRKVRSRALATRFSRRAAPRDCQTSGCQ